MLSTVFILLPVHNRYEMTTRFLISLKNQTYQNFHLLLIDDGSTDGTAEIVRERMQKVTVIRGNGNWWWAGCLQVGYNWLKVQELTANDIVLIINDDTEFDPTFLENAIELLKNTYKTLLLAECYDRKDGKLIDGGIKLDWSLLKFEKPNNVDEINCLSTRGLFLKAKYFIQIGGFYPKLLPHYLSDYEFTIRAKRKGYKLLVDSKLKLNLDLNATGFHSFAKRPSLQLIRKYFSKKSAASPISWTVFIILACPWKWKIINIFRIWFVFIFKSIKAIFLNQFLTVTNR
ncbi:MAG: glycosyltransferase [Melioribacteraceae bacterium]